MSPKAEEIIKANRKKYKCFSTETPIKTVFEYNCLQIDGATLGGCPICPICEEPAYEKDRCVFCGQRFERGEN